MLGRGVTTDTEDREINKIIPGVYGDPNTGEPIRDGEGNKIQNGTMVEVNSIWFGETFAINSADEWNVFDATVIRLREVSLGYRGTDAIYRWRGFDHRQCNSAESCDID